MAQCAVLIVNWNSWELLSRCLSALSRQTFRDFQVFIADNASDQPPVIFGDGEQTRDFISVFDVVQANVIALDPSCQGTFNISTGQEISINTLTQYLTGISGKDITAQYAPPRQGEAQRSSADSRKFQKNFQWKPTWTLEQGLSETFEYFANTHQTLKA